MVNKTELSDWIQMIDHDFRQIARYDHSVSVPSWGTLFRYEPDTPLGQAQQYAAQVYGVPFAYPSTNGTTPLNVMALMALAQPGDTVLVQRDSHVSVLAPIIHLGVRPVYVAPRYSQRLGVTMGITPQELRQVLDQHPQSRAIFLTYPNYFGIATDIEGCARVAAEHGVPLIVDSAHGAHWAFHPIFPIRAEQAGAAIVTQSTHKTCPALGQGSLALFNDEAIIERFYEVVNHLGFVSTSFSSVILTALFKGIRMLHEEGHQLLGQRIEMVEWARAEINRTEGLRSFGAEEIQPGFVAYDPLRLTVDISELELTGFEIEEILIRNYGHYAEMATLENVLFLITLGTTWAGIRHLVAALKRIAHRPRPERSLPAIPFPDQPRQVLTPREVFFSQQRRTLPVRDAIGKVSAETISAYPPGSAVVVAGEEITAEVVEFLRAVQGHGGVLKGASDPDFVTIQVVEAE